MGVQCRQSYSIGLVKRNPPNQCDLCGKGKVKRSKAFRLDRDFFLLLIENFLARKHFGAAVIPPVQNSAA